MRSCDRLAHRFAEAAASFVGTPFRLHGRDPATGLDCVGLIYVSLLAIGRPANAPEGYRLRNHDVSRWFGYARDSGFEEVSGEAAHGDLLMTRPSPGQSHLQIVDGYSLTHAHAGLGRVVRQPVATMPHPVAHWRLAVSQ